MYSAFLFWGEITACSTHCHAGLVAINARNRHCEAVTHAEFLRLQHHPMAGTVFSSVIRKPGPYKRLGGSADFSSYWINSDILASAVSLQPLAWPAREQNVLGELF